MGSAALYGMARKLKVVVTGGHPGVSIKGVSVSVLYAGPAPGFGGLDQVNVALSPGLRGSGGSDIVLSMDGQTSNAVTISIQ